MSDWQTVPRKTTRAMRAAGAQWAHDSPASAEATYTAMIAAAPPPPAVRVTPQMVEEARTIIVEESRIWQSFETVEKALTAALAVSFPIQQDWQDISTAPKDGTPVAGQELYRFQPYKPEGQKQMGQPGRWQRFNGFGWENAPPPTHWMPLGTPIHGAER